MGKWTYEQKKIWNAKNPDKVREYRKRYEAKHAKEIKRKRREYYCKNKEDILEKNRIYRLSHPEYYDKHYSYICNRTDYSAYYMEFYDHNIILAELDIQCKYRTMIERKVFE